MPYQRQVLVRNSSALTPKGLESMSTVMACPRNLLRQSVRYRLSS